ncbi:EthD family reductase [Goekera deserti]|uniref:EthD family reductase n=1 Tax=Goekera deserti TaxID=2497753 RepID=A0A7K3WH52_9ACTN|nr:EthD family reductase [Goekera deserti]NDI49857.1 EthD family reductase [Goekera deserti]NEL55219.1 EthD family reductase [Goekera deserti]
MTVSYFALYQTPADPTDFEQHYAGTHVPLVEKVPGLVENRVHRVIRQFVGKPAYHLIAELVFESAEAMEQALTSPEWTAAGDDLREWGGIELATMFSAEPHRPGSAGADATG